MTHAQECPELLHDLPCPICERRINAYESDRDHPIPDPWGADDQAERERMELTLERHKEWWDK